MMHSSAVIIMNEFSIQGIKQVKSIICSNPYIPVFIPEYTMNLITRNRIRISTIMLVVVSHPIMGINDR